MKESDSQGRPSDPSTNFQGLFYNEFHRRKKKSFKLIVKKSYHDFKKTHFPTVEAVFGKKHVAFFFNSKNQKNSEKFQEYEAWNRLINRNMITSFCVPSEGV